MSQPDDTSRRDYHDEVLLEWQHQPARPLGAAAEPIEAAVVPEPRGSRRRRFWLPLVLFLATCWSTLYAGSNHSLRPTADGVIYFAALMIILVCHESGHYLQARRYGVRASLPFFLPLPISPIGTLGAVIAMDTRIGDRKSLFDIGISGPLAGLVPTLAFSLAGLYMSEVHQVVPVGLRLGEPLLFKAMAWWVFGPLPEGMEIYLHPMAFAGWVGLLITALNLIPIGQLDGGHILYALFRRRAHAMATAFLFIAAAAVFAFGYYGWVLMLFLLMLMGPKHPPTRNDYVPLGWPRVVLGLAMLAFVIVGFTPMPIEI